MKLQNLIKGLNPQLVLGPTDVEVPGLCHDSRLFKPGELFIAVRGGLFDGHQFLPAACARGASAVIVESKDAVPSDFKNTVVVVADSRGAVDVLASNFYEHPTENLFVAGVTGTNGKTTTTHMIEAVLNGHELPTGVMGTIDCHLGNQRIPSTHTTPDALNLQKIMAGWRENGARAVSMEVSSHSLAQKRVDSVAFDVAVFTNLTRDHLDFHGSMEEYAKAKGRLFHELLERSPKKKKRAVLNADDSAWLKMKPARTPVWTFGFNDADFKVEDCRLSLDGTELVVLTPAGKAEATLKMIGRHNVYNALAAMAVGLQAGVPLSKSCESLSALTGVRGRLERVPSGTKRVFVDYAHSDDALTNVLSFLSQLKNETSPHSRIITVFGCGGDRDRGKRPLMLKAARQHSDHVIVTSDNPRTEDPEAIIDDILKGHPRASLPKNIEVHVDRKQAIELALKEAGPDDVVLIAGKGHEDYQIIGTKKYPFDDVQIAKEILNR